MYATWIELNRLRAQQILNNEFVQRDCTRIQCQKDRETHNVFVGKSTCKAVLRQVVGFFFTFHYFHK